MIVQNFLTSGFALYPSHLILGSIDSTVYYMTDNPNLLIALEVNQHIGYV
jgi:hypothetical protein